MKIKISELKQALNKAKQIQTAIKELKIIANAQCNLQHCLPSFSIRNGNNMGAAMLETDKDLDEARYTYKLEIDCLRPELDAAKDMLKILMAMQYPTIKLPVTPKGEMSWTKDRMTACEVREESIHMENGVAVNHIPSNQVPDGQTSLTEFDFSPTPEDKKKSGRSSWSLEDRQFINYSIDGLIDDETKCADGLTSPYVMQDRIKYPLVNQIYHLNLIIQRFIAEFNQSHAEFSSSGKLMA